MKATLADLEVHRQAMIDKIMALEDGDTCVLVTRSKNGTGVTSDIWSGHPKAWTLAADLMTLAYTGIVLPKAQVEFAKGSGGEGAPPAVSA